MLCVPNERPYLFPSVYTVFQRCTAGVQLSVLDGCPPGLRPFCPFGLFRDGVRNRPFHVRRAAADGWVRSLPRYAGLLAWRPS